MRFGTTVLPCVALLLTISVNVSADILTEATQSVTQRWFYAGPVKSQKTTSLNI